MTKGLCRTFLDAFVISSAVLTYILLIVALTTNVFIGPPGPRGQIGQTGAKGDAGDNGLTGPSGSDAIFDALQSNVTELSSGLSSLELLLGADVTELSAVLANDYSRLGVANRSDYNVVELLSSVVLSLSSLVGSDVNSLNGTLISLNRALGVDVSSLSSANRTGYSLIAALVTSVINLQKQVANIQLFVNGVNTTWYGQVVISSFSINGAGSGYTSPEYTTYLSGSIRFSYSSTSTWYFPDGNYQFSFYSVLYYSSGSNCQPSIVFEYLSSCSTLLTTYTFADTSAASALNPAVIYGIYDVRVTSGDCIQLFYHDPGLCTYSLTGSGSIMLIQ